MGYPRHLQQFDEERNTPAFYKTSGFAKLWWYFVAITESAVFKQEILKIRATHGILKDGYALPEKGEWTHPPLEWKAQKDRDRWPARSRVLRDLDSLCMGYALLPRDWTGPMENYLFYNRVLFFPQPHMRNLCFMSDAVTGADLLGHKIDDADRQAYPLLIHVSPYASERDILDFIRKTFNPEMARVLTQYKKGDVKIGKYRKRNKTVRERNQLLKEKGGRSDKELAKIAREKFPKRPLKVSSISKTLARENKRRQKA